MIVPSFQKWSSSTPPSRAIHVNVSRAIADMAPNCDWGWIFNRVFTYFEPFNVVVCSFPWQTDPILICEVEVLWANPFGKGAPKARGVTHDNAFVKQVAGQSLCRYKSFVWLREITADGMLPGSLSDPVIADCIAHEAVHHYCGPRHIDPKKDGQPGVPGTAWLMAEDMDESKPKILDNYSRRDLLKRLGAKR